MFGDSITLRTWQEKFELGDFNSPDRFTQIKAGWYDWFCKDSSLRNKTYKMGNIIKQIKDTGKVDLDTNYVFFKNNCPMSGPLYDDFRICRMDNGNVQFTIQIDCCWSDSKYTVYGREPDGTEHFDKPMFETNSSRELVKWLNTKW